ncbi:MAG: dockerin type I repeat-containing protein [Oscillospiraceae bacterium]|nr:dockerin type I repeat-containing protein [Oscillospiraceae bacterium]
MDEDAYSLGGSGDVEVTPTETTTTQSTAASETTETTTTTTTTTVVNPDQPSDVVYGDVNCDGKVSIADVLALNKNLMSGEVLSASGSVNADVDGDGKPTAADALSILKFTIMVIDTLPV